MTTITADIDPVILYILMRTDLPDYIPGKSMAQANHAGTKFVAEAVKRPHPSYAQHFEEWMGEAGGFGTCIVLGCSYREMELRLDTAHHLGLHAGLIHDPTYPIRDGHKLHTLPIDTCAYIFGRKSRCQNAVFDLRLFAVD